MIHPRSVATLGFACKNKPLAIASIGFLCFAAQDLSGTESHRVYVQEALYQVSIERPGPRITVALDSLSVSVQKIAYGVYVTADTQKAIADPAAQVSASEKDPQRAAPAKDGGNAKVEALDYHVQIAAPSYNIRVDKARFNITVI